MNILITGITGLFGSQLAREFSQIGIIHGLRRDTSNLDLVKDFDFEIHWHYGDLSNMDSLLETLEGIDLVIHSAGCVSFSSKDEDKLYEVNSIGTANVVNAMLHAGVRRLVHVSSVAAIGRSTDLAILDEDFKWTESPLNTPYALSKYWAELEAWRGEQEGLDLIVVNPSVLLGKANAGRSSTLIYTYVLEENRFFPKGDVNFIDVRDAAKITRSLVEAQAWGSRFILNAASIPYQVFFAEVAQVFGKKAPSRPIQDWMISIASLGLGLMRLLGLGKNQVTKQVLRVSQQKIRFDNAKVQKMLDHRYFTLRESLEWAKNP